MWSLGLHSVVGEPVKGAFWYNWSVKIIAFIWALYFIIVKSRTPAEGRISYLSRKQRLRLKSLFLRSNYVTLSWHLDALKAGTLLCGSCFYPSPGDTLWVAVTPLQIAVTKHNFTWTGCPYRWPFSPPKREFAGLTFWEMGSFWISCSFH